MGKKEFATGIAKQKTVTPKALKALAKGLLDPSHPDFGGQGQFNDPSDPSNNVIHYIGNNKESAEGECDSVCRYVHDHLPHGSHVVVSDNPDKGINHFVHHVPTTEGTGRGQAAGRAERGHVQAHSRGGERRGCEIQQRQQSVAQEIGGEDSRHGRHVVWFYAERIVARWSPSRFGLGAASGDVFLP